MSEFFDSLKADLLDRRLLPILALVGVALVAAVAYAVLGGGGSASPGGPTAASSPAPATKAGSIPVTPASTSSVQPVAETTDGASHQHGGASRNPFSPLPGAKTASTSTTGSTSGSSGSSSSSAPSSSAPTKSSGGTSPAPTKPVAPAKPPVYIHFHVTMQFGVVPAAVAGTPPQPAQLTTYNDIALDQPFPSKANPQLVYLGVVLKTGNDAAFALTGAAILHGSATCKPSPTQCQAIELQIGQSETLEVVEANGSSVTYELKLLSITKSVSSSASTARVHDALRAASKAARELHRRVPALAGLHYSVQQGGLVLANRAAFAARAHAARRR